MVEIKIKRLENTRAEKQETRRRKKRTTGKISTIDRGLAAKKKDNKKNLFERNICRGYCSNCSSDQYLKRVFVELWER